MAYTSLSDDISTLSQFTRRKTITITTAGTSTPSNYQVKLTITYEPEMQANFNDIRFNTKAGVYIDYWIETYTTSTTATVWIELPDAITDPGSDILLMYYGNPGLSDGGNIEDMSLFGDDFDNDLSKWTTNGTPSISDGILTLNGVEERVRSVSTHGPYNIILRSRVLPETDTQQEWGFYDGIGEHLGVSEEFACEQLYSTGIEYTDTKLNNGIVEQIDIGAYTATYQNREIGWISDNVYFYKDDNLKSTHTTVPDSALYVQLVQRSAGNFLIDWVFIRKHITNEPTLSYGIPQHQRRIPQFIG